MERKSEENLDAAKRLLEEPVRSDSFACPNAAASRAYYAAYLGTWAGMVHARIQPPAIRSRRYFPHSNLPSESGLPGLRGLPSWAEEAEVLDDATAEQLRLLHYSRIKADYYPEDVEVEEAAERIKDAEAVLAFALDRGAER